MSGCYDFYLAENKLIKQKKKLRKQQYSITIFVRVSHSLNKFSHIEITLTENTSSVKFSDNQNIFLKLSWKENLLNYYTKLTYGSQNLFKTE